MQVPVPPVQNYSFDNNVQSNALSFILPHNPKQRSDMASLKLLALDTRNQELKDFFYVIIL